MWINTKRYFPKKFLSLISPGKMAENGGCLSKLVKSSDVTEKYLSFTLSIFFSGSSVWENKVMVCKNFLGKYFFLFVEYLCNRYTKMRTKNFKNYIFILAVVKYRNCLDASPLLTLVRNHPSKSWLHACWWHCIRKLLNSCKQIAQAVMTRVLLYCAAYNFCNKKFVIVIVQKKSELLQSSINF